MNLKDYFETREGHGVLATSNAEGEVDLAIYARPHVMEDGSVAFIMTDRLSHENLKSNPRAAYLFLEKAAEGGPRFVGKRLFLTKKAEERDTDRVKELRRRTYEDDRDGRNLVTFHVDRVLPAVGDGGEPTGRMPR